MNLNNEAPNKTIRAIMPNASDEKGLNECPGLLNKPEMGQGSKIDDSRDMT